MLDVVEFRKEKKYLCSKNPNSRKCVRADLYRKRKFAFLNEMGFYSMKINEREGALSAYAKHLKEAEE